MTDIQSVDIRQLLKCLEGTIKRENAHILQVKEVTEDEYNNIIDNIYILESEIIRRCERGKDETI